jgi:hypothetical protein
VLYSYSQISQYLSCPRRYRHRYLDGWMEKDTRAAMLFGRAFEKALDAYFLRQDSAAIFYQEWAAHREQPLTYSRHDTWDRMLEQGIQLLNRFCQEDRVRIHQPRRNLQIKFTRPLSAEKNKASESGKKLKDQSADQCSNEFVAYVDAIGQLDGKGCLLEWKTASARYPEEPAGLLALDPQLICYSWITGISDVAEVVFVRKRLVEIQYLRTTISDEQRREFGDVVHSTIQQIEGAQFLPHSGIRFPQNPCTSCPYLGLCLNQPQLAERRLLRRPGAGSFGVFDELDY